MYQTFNKFIESINKQQEDKIQQLENNPNISFFFQKSKEIYAGPEESRLAFARLKNPDEEDKSWAKDGNFIGISMSDAISGEGSEHLFGIGDLNDIKVLDKERAFKLLRQK